MPTWSNSVFKWNNNKTSGFCFLSKQTFLSIEKRGLHLSFFTTCLFFKHYVKKKEEYFIFRIPTSV